MSTSQCREVLSEVPLKSAAFQSSPATLLHRTIQRRLTQGQVTPGHRARRRLFSAVDADDVSRFVKRELAAIRAADRRRYNFDFDKMQPLEGRFQWERVGAALSPCENTPASLLHRSARRLELDCPRAQTADRPGEPGRDRDMDTKTSASEHVTCLGKHRVCFPSAEDASSGTLTEPSQLRCGQSQDSCLSSKTATERLASIRLRQTALTDLWQTRKRASVWEAAESQPKKRVRSVLMSSAPDQHLEGQSEDERPAVHGRQSVLSQLQGQNVVPS